MQKGEWLPFSRRFSFCIPWPVKSALHFTGLHSAFFILHSSFFILPFHPLGEGERGSLFVEVAADDLEEGVRGKGLLEEAALGAP